MTSTPSLQPTQMQGEGRGVPLSFRLPWNTTRTMDDVWPHDPKLDVRAVPESKELPLKKPKPRKAGYAGRDQRERQFK